MTFEERNVLILNEAINKLEGRVAELESIVESLKKKKNGSKGKRIGIEGQGGKQPA